MKPYYQSKRVTLYCGDCLSILPHLSGVDAVVTDPPYGLGIEYASFDDTIENVRAVVVGAMPEMLRLGRVVMLTPGNGNQHRFPPPTHTLAWVNRSASSRGPWGFCCWQPVMVWGKCPDIHKGCKHDVLMSGPNDQASNHEHPCAKPMDVMLWMIERAAPGHDQVILDPFMGSGTTGVAAIRLGRKFIGIEIDEGYCKIAERRIREAEQAFALFDPPAPETQAEMFS